MAKVVCVLYDDPIGGHPKSYARELADRNLLLGRPWLYVMDAPPAGPHRVSRCSLWLGMATGDSRWFPGRVKGTAGVLYLVGRDGSVDFNHKSLLSVEDRPAIKLRLGPHKPSVSGKPWPTAICRFLEEMIHLGWADGAWTEIPIGSSGFSVGNRVWFFQPRIRRFC